MPRRRGTNTGIPGLSFSMNRALGVRYTKRTIARATGIPTTRSGRQRKMGRMMTRGCLMTALCWIAAITCIASVLGQFAQ